MSVDYYAALEVSPQASQQEIREAYKKAALKNHPDRVSHNDPSRAARTRKFQQINDAYYTLCDPQRRRDYDSTRAYQNSYRNPQHAQSDWQDDQFADIFEEMMREEGFAENTGEQTTPNGKFWGILGGLSGGVMGFIVANVPGMLAGAVAGNRLGAVRDSKGKSVYEVFQELPQSDRAKVGARILLSATVIGGAIAIGGLRGKLTKAVVVSCLVIWPQRCWRTLLAVRWNVRFSRSRRDDSQ